MPSSKEQTPIAARAPNPLPHSRAPQRQPPAKHHRRAQALRQNRAVVGRTTTRTPHPNQLLRAADIAVAVHGGRTAGIRVIFNVGGVDGDVNIDGGDLTVSTTTFNLVNTTATTLNAATSGDQLVTNIYRSYTVPFRVEKRATPTPQIYDQAGNAGKISIVTGSSGTSWVLADNAVPNSWSISQYTGTTSFGIRYGFGGTTGGLSFHWIADAEL